MIALGSAASAQPGDPPLLRRFAEPGSRIIAMAGADLDQDGRKDYLLVLEEKPRPDAEPYEGRAGQLLILLQMPDGSLREAARATDDVLCSSCGGTWSDPFDGVQAAPGTLPFCTTAGARTAGEWT